MIVMKSNVSWCKSTGAIPIILVAKTCLSTRHNKLAPFLQVTGSNKGIGFATVKALCSTAGSGAVVYLTARSVERGNDAVKKLNKEGLKPRFHPLDVDDASSIATFASFLKKEHGGLDVLVNNAAIAYKVETLACLNLINRFI